MSADILAEMADNCILTRTRVISRMLTGIYDEEYRPLGINTWQVTMLLIIHKLGRPSRADIGRFNHQERSTLTRNLKLLLDEGWIEEVDNPKGGRSRPISLTPSGEAMLRNTGEAFKRAQAKAEQLIGKAGVDVAMTVTSKLMKFPTKSS